MFHIVIRFKLWFSNNLTNDDLYVFKITYNYPKLIQFTTHAY